MPSANLLGLGGTAKTYKCAIEGSSGGISGTILTIADQLYSKSMTVDDI